MLENKQAHPRRLSSPSLSVFPLTRRQRASPRRPPGRLALILHDSSSRQIKCRNVSPACYRRLSLTHFLLRFPSPLSSAKTRISSRTWSKKTPIIIPLLFAVPSGTLPVPVSQLSRTSESAAVTPWKYPKHHARRSVVA